MKWIVHVVKKPQKFRGCQLKDGKRTVSLQSFMAHGSTFSFPGLSSLYEDS